MTGTERRARTTLVVLAVLLAVLVVRLAGAGLPGTEHLYEALTLAAAGCCLWRAATYRPERWAWLAIGLGMLSYASADVYYTVAFGDSTDVPFPSPADALYLGIYPGCYIGLVLLLRQRARNIPGGAWLDGLIGALGFAALAAAVLIDAVVSDTGGDVVAVATNIAYPLGDVLLIAVVVGMVTVTGRRVGRTWLTVAAAFAVLAAVDVVYLFQVAEGTYRLGGLLDVGWPAALLLLATAAWQRPATAVAQAREARIGAVPALAGIGSLVILVIDHYRVVNEPALWLASACILAVVVRFGLTFRENARMLRAVRVEATTDALTGLGNRRLLMEDLQRVAASAQPARLALFDLDGFKQYNDSYGHPAGDLLLKRLGAALREATDVPGARAYRMGGDEFCVLLVGAAAGDETLVRRAGSALTESGDGFAIGASLGAVRLPDEAAVVSDALALADRRMYADKRGSRPSAGSQSRDVLLRAVHERNPELGDHVGDVAELAEATARALGLGGEEIVLVRHAAELHDIGKLAIPDAILDKPGPLDAGEREFMRRHTVIGERIIAAAPALTGVAPLVRSSHEAWDGSGYPDGLAGEAIPLGARIVAVCDAWDAMTTDRPYRRAMPAAAAIEELQRCAGGQFDPAVVAAFCSVVGERSHALAA